MQHRSHALGRYGKIGDRHDGADHGSEFLALHRAGLDADLHSRLHVLAALRRNIDQRLEFHTLAFDCDDRCADGEHRPRRDLDLEDTSLDRADDLGVLVQHSGNSVHLPARVIEGEFRLLDFARALRLQIRLLRPQLQDFVPCIFLSLLRICQIATAILDVASGGVSLGQQVLEILEIDRQIFDALVGRLHDLIEGRLEFRKVLAL